MFRFLSLSFYYKLIQIVYCKQNKNLKTPSLSQPSQSLSSSPPSIICEVNWNLSSVWCCTNWMNNWMNEWKLLAFHKKKTKYFMVNMWSSKKKKKKSEKKRKMKRNETNMKTKTQRKTCELINCEINICMDVCMYVLRH